MSEVEHRPTILMVGQGEPMQTALGEALRRHGISVAGCATAELEQAVRVYAPDLVVLIGDAAVRGGSAVVKRMAGNRATDVLPIAIVSNDSALQREGRDFRTGAVAIVPRGAGADAIARRLAELAEEVPDRPGLMSGELTGDNLRDVVDLVSNDVKRGILSIRSPAGPLEGIPMVIETEGEGAHAMERVLERLQDAVASSGSLHYEFQETSGGRLSALPGPIEPDEVDLGQLQGTRIVILDSNELRAEKLAQVLMKHGVQIAAADFSTAVIPRIREIDPQVVVLDSSAVGGQGIDVVRAMRKDPQLRWASMLVVRWEDFWPSSDTEAEPDVAQLASRIYPLIDQDAQIAERVEDEVDFDTRLELVGPGRLIRALGSIPGVRHVAVAGPKRSVEIDIADNSIVGAYATLHEGTKQTLQGMPALLAAWGMNAGRVSVREQDLPSVANIMMPIDEALGVVSHQLGFADGSESSVQVTAETMPPLAGEVDEHATVPPGGEGPSLDEARTMAPPRFQRLQRSPESTANASFPEEEVPTNKVQAIGRLSTRRAVPVARGKEEQANKSHVDHGVARARTSKSTQLGLAPAFEVLPDDVPDEQRTLAVPPRRTPPPPPVASRKRTPPPLFDDGDDIDLAHALEGTTVVAPARAAGAMPAWIQGLVLVTLISGVAVAGWLLWSRAGTSEARAPSAAGEAEGRKGPITGTVNGLGSDAADADATELEPTEAQTDSTDLVKRDDVEAAAPETETAAATQTTTATETPSAQKTKPETDVDDRGADQQVPTQPVVPTKNLPRDPAKASDVLVHRALPFIRKGQLALAQATLDRAFELDPKNPQAMAGYARLYLAKKDGAKAVKWAKKAAKRRRRRSEYHVLYGDALQLEGDVAAARKAWRRALSVDPDNRAAKARLAASKARASN